MDKNISYIVVHCTATPPDTSKVAIKRLIYKYPKAEVKGHRDFPNVHKACPSFDVKTCLALYEPIPIQSA
jgi:hypothetical protein